MFSWFFVIVSFFSTSIFAYRFFMLLVGTSFLVSLYYLTRRIFSENVAFFALLVSGFSFYHILASTQIASEQVVGLFYLLFFWSYLDYKDLISKERNVNKQKNHFIGFFTKKPSFYLFLCGIILGFSLLIKENAIFMTIILFLWQSWTFITSRVSFRNLKELDFKSFILDYYRSFLHFVPIIFVGFFFFFCFLF